MKGRDDLVEVVTKEPHRCGTCRKVIPAGSPALMGGGQMFDGRGNSITVQVFYHEDCPPFRSRQIRKITKRKGGRRRRKKRRWENQS